MKGVQHDVTFVLDPKTDADPDPKTDPDADPDPDTDTDTDAIADAIVDAVADTDEAPAATREYPLPPWNVTVSPRRRNHCRSLCTHTEHGAAALAGAKQTARMLVFTNVSL